MGVRGRLRPGLTMALLAVLAVSLLMLASPCPAEVADHAEARAALPSAEEIAKLPPDGGDEFNRLIHQKSPYLLQHARNPVNWFSWGEEAFARARAEGKPVFLSVGYSTCYWCHVMERESFERDDVAAILNEHFIAIKVDREERPDVDDIYMTATHLMTGSGGWPNSVWMTPDGRPFFAGTYFPREDAGGRTGFKTILNALAEAWETRRDDVEAQADRISDAMRASADSMLPPGGTGEPDLTLVERAISELRLNFDTEWGGFGSAPKFPPHMSLRLLLYQYERTGRDGDLALATDTLDAMARGGIRDHVGGGFHRYSTDRQWLVPHFEKMLYDNAQLLRAYVDAYRLTGDEAYRRVADEICGWVLREMQRPGGGFYSALDAESEGEEGKFYVWTRDEIVDALGEGEGDLFARVYGVTAKGNFLDARSGKRTGANVLHLPERPADVAQEESVSVDQLRERLDAARTSLLARRAQRARPHLDDKVLAAWNGLMIGALAHAGRHLETPRYTAAAQEAARFVLGQMRRDGRLVRSYREGASDLGAYLSDYAFVAAGLLELHAATGQESWLQEARALADTMVDYFADEEAGGFFTTARDHEELLYRTKSPMDGAEPSGNGVAAQVLVELARLTGDQRYRDLAVSSLRAFAGSMDAIPRATGGLILAAAMYGEGEAVQPVIAERLPDATSRRGPVAVDVFVAEYGALAVRIAMAEGWHVNSHRPLDDYLIPTEVRTPAGSAWRLADLTYPMGKRVTLGFSTEPLSVYEGTVWVRGRLAGGEGEAVIEVVTQACNDRMCEAAVTHVLPVRLP